MTYKKYTRTLLIAMILFFASNAILWNGLTKKTFINESDQGHGDLSRLGYIALGHSKLPQTDKVIGNQHLEMKEYLAAEAPTKIDILTIGDSFSNGGAGSYYQDWIASKYSMNVLNVSKLPGNNALETLTILEHSGILNKIDPRSIIIETVGRACKEHYGKTMNFEDEKYKKLTADQICNYYLSLAKTNKKSIDRPVKILDERMLEGNIKTIYAWYAQTQKLEKLSSHAYVSELIEDKFTNQGFERSLVYYSDDIINYISKEDAEIINHNLNRMEERLRKRNRQLVFMICVDKRDLYYDYIANKNMPNPLFAYMREMDKKYIFIDTKKILTQEIQKGEKDLYWCDDTHWSWKGERIVVDDMLKDSTKLNFTYEGEPSQ